MTVLSLNARSIVNKTDLLPLFFDCYNAQIIFITESWLKNSIPDCLFGLQDKFRLLRKDRISQLGGGVCAFVSIELDVLQINLPSNYQHLELLFRSRCFWYQISLCLLLSSTLLR
jgi:hypothetical protein